MDILVTEKLTKIYGKAEAEVRALDGVDLVVSEGEFLSIVGSSGSGKSTLLHMLGGLDRPTSGKVIVAGEELGKLSAEALTIFRRRNIGFVFQAYNLVPVLNVRENITLPLWLDGSQPDAAYLENVVATLGLRDLSERLPGQLSGGQQQRVAIARALAGKPSIILADEPTGNLDSRSGADVLGLLKLVCARFSSTMVMITHDEGIAQLADRILRLEDGRFVGC